MKAYGFKRLDFKFYMKTHDGTKICNIGEPPN